MTPPDAPTGAPEPAHVLHQVLPQVLSHVESLPLGEAVILHNRESGAIVSTNAFGAVLIDTLRRNPGEADITGAVAAALGVAGDEVRAAVTGTLERWTADGLFLDAQRHFPMSLPYQRCETGAERLYALGGRTVCLASEDPDLAADLDRALAPMALAAGPGARTEGAARLDVVTDGEAYWAFRDGAPVWGAAAYELTRFHVLREIMDLLCGPDRVAAHLHASALAGSGSADSSGGLVFAGASGSGKSTLATLLLGEGARFVSDDHVALDISGAALLAFPTRPNLKPGTAELPRVRAVIAAEGAGQGGFVPRARVPAGTAVPLRGIVFPRYDPAGANTLEPMAPDAALRALIQTGSRVSRGTRSIAPLVHALAAHPVHRLDYADTDFAIARCLALLDG